MNKEEFITELKALNIEPTKEMLEKLEIYKEFLKEYNKHTNLTAIKEDNDIYLKHFYDSLTITKVVDLHKINNLIDIGTGAGFPGMVLKIFFPHLKVTLLDSNHKKTDFLEKLQEKLNIEVEIINDRVEDYAKNNLNKFDLVTSRAVANLRVLAEISLPLVKLNGLFVPLKGNIDKELEDAKDTLEILNTQLVNSVTFDLFNNSGIRNIYVFKKTKETLSNTLRSYDKILKKPLKKSSK